MHNEVSGAVQGNVTQARDIYHHPPAPTALAGLPPVAAEFTGRAADLALVAEALRSPRPVVVSTGLAGVGKTSLAVKAAHDAFDAGLFPGGVLFVDLQGYSATTRVEPPTALSGFLNALGVHADQVPITQPDRETLYRSRLAGREPMLIVLDNASSAEQVRPLLPPGDQHRVLVTSRHTLGDLHGARRIPLDVLLDADSVAMVENLLKASDPDDGRVVAEPDAAQAIAELCGRLPLALGIVAALLCDDPELPLSAAAALLRETRLNELSYHENLAVRAAFDLSHDRLAAGEQRLFRLLSLNPGTQVSTEAAAALADLPATATRKLLNGLRRAHMIESGDPHGWFRFHDLLRLYAAERLDADEPEPEREAAAIRLIDFYVTATELAAQRRPSSGHQRADAAWLRTERANLAGAIALAHRLGHYDQVLRLAFTMGTYLFYNRRHSEEGLAAYELALDAAARLGDTSGEAMALLGLGRIHRQMDDFAAARERFDAAVVLSRTLGDLASEGRALHNLGSLARRRSDFPSAWTQYRRALVAYREAGDRVGEAQIHFVMGLLSNAQDQPELAAQHYRTCVGICAEIGRNDLEGRAHKRLALMALETGDREVALHHLEAARAAYLADGLHRRARLLRPLFRKIYRPRRRVRR